MWLCCSDFHRHRIIWDDDQPSIRQLINDAVIFGSKNNLILRLDWNSTYTCGYSRLMMMICDDNIEIIAVITKETIYIFIHFSLTCNRTISTNAHRNRYIKTICYSAIIINNWNFVLSTWAAILWPKTSLEYLEYGPLCVCGQCKHILWRCIYRYLPFAHCLLWAWTNFIICSIVFIVAQMVNGEYWCVCVVYWIWWCVAYDGQFTFLPLVDDWGHAKQ